MAEDTITHKFVEARDGDEMFLFLLRVYRFF